MENTLNQAIKLIKRHEGLRLHAYRCPAGKLTIGWGHTLNVTPSSQITAERAEQLLVDDASRICRQLDALQVDSNVTLTSSQRAALISFAFNVGFDALKRSTLWRLIAANTRHPDIGREFARWKYAGGKVMPGLEKRRREEAALYLSR